MSVQNKTKLLIFTCLLALGGVFAPNINKVSSYWQNCTTAPSVCTSAFVCFVAGCNPTYINYDAYTPPSCTPQICTPPVCYGGGCSPPNCWMGSCWPGGCYPGWCSGGGCSGGGCTPGGYAACAPGTINCDNSGGCHGTPGTCGYTATTCTPGATSCSCGGVAGYSNWTSCNAANGTETGYNPYYHNNCWDAASTRGCGVCNSTTAVTNYATAPPAASRCAFGTGGTPTLVGSTWSWICYGSGGSHANCTAPYIVNGSCNGQLAAVHEYNVNIFPAGSLCTTGTPSPAPAAVAFPITGGAVYWQCVGSGGGGTTANCSASRKLRPPTVDLKINGSDGPISPNRDAGHTLNISWNVTNNNTSGTTWCSKSGSTWGTGWLTPSRPLQSSDVNIPLPSGGYPISNSPYSLTCRNEHNNPALNSTSVTDTVGVSVSCDPGPEVWTDCDTQCDGGNKTCKTENGQCVIVDCATANATCNTDSCPVSGEIREVQ